MHINFSCSVMIIINLHFCTCIINYLHQHVKILLHISLYMVFIVLCAYITLRAIAWSIDQYVATTLSRLLIWFVMNRYIIEVTIYLVEYWLLFETSILFATTILQISGVKKREIPHRFTLTSTIVWRNYKD